jgi:hypothetical protein
MPKFHYSSYWAAWSRRLGVHDGLVIELNLTPVACCYSSTWESDVKPEKIRCHRHIVVDRPGDIDTDILPEGVQTMMLQILGFMPTCRLLTFDYLKIVPVDKLIEAERKWKLGGGAPWAFIMEICHGAETV